MKLLVLWVLLDGSIGLDIPEMCEAACGGSVQSYDAVTCAACSRPPACHNLKLGPEDADTVALLSFDKFSWSIKPDDKQTLVASAKTAPQLRSFNINRCSKDDNDGDLDEISLTVTVAVSVPYVRQNIAQKLWYKLPKNENFKYTLQLGELFKDPASDRNSGLKDVKHTVKPYKIDLKNKKKEAPTELTTTFFNFELVKSAKDFIDAKGHTKANQILGPTLASSKKASSSAPFLELKCETKDCFKEKELQKMRVCVRYSCESQGVLSGSAKHAQEVLQENKKRIVSQAKTPQQALRLDLQATTATFTAFKASLGGLDLTPECKAAVMDEVAVTEKRFPKLGDKALKELKSPTKKSKLEPEKEKEDDIDFDEVFSAVSIEESVLTAIGDSSVKD